MLLGRHESKMGLLSADAGVETVLLAGYEARRATGTLPASVTVRPFDSFAELRAGLEAEAAAGADLLLMAAAVSDYSPVPFTGKLSSGADEMILRMTRNPKLLDGLRSLFGDAARLVGFKLLSGVSRDELIAVASRQCRRASLDATVANDLAELGGADHVALQEPLQRRFGVFQSKGRGTAGAGRGGTAHDLKTLPERCGHA